MWHDKWCWERWHCNCRKGLSCDWEDEETFRKNHSNGGIIDFKKIMEKRIYE
jgi:hypothetical protein